MKAGDTYTFDIQSRDFFSNNKKELLGSSVNPNLVELKIVELDPLTLLMTTVHSGSIADKAGMAGVFEVSFSPTKAGANFRYSLALNSLSVDEQSVHNFEPLVIIPADTTSAATSNFTILALSHQIYQQYKDQATYL